ncbi:DsbA family oxidoreductase [Rubrivivax rivuli]|uniref:DsbA family oxidoreductase n=1 Tax=Rubrivivax rivuli TaxID=1862385 RepID=A0A437RS86_9BURK|nr:DsbA family oxidoreductase [Rubrivivax rivuli]RVU49616.1 DsbA family oxidoreductase [Rubrivivax rivuli]
MSTPVQIDFVSDIACPWCAVGLNALEVALQRLAPEVQATLHFQPFELNPQLGPEGEDAAEHLKAKYGLSDEQLAQNRANIRARGAAVGFSFGDRARVWNTFDAHRLLHWAAEPGQPAGAQRALKHALLQVYHGENRNPGDAAVLLEMAAKAGLDTTAAAEVLQSGRFAEEVRAAEHAWQQAGIRSVPAIVINRQHLISGGQPPEVFEQALRQIAAGQA